MHEASASLQRVPESLQTKAALLILAHFGLLTL